MFSRNFLETFESKDEVSQINEKSSSESSKNLIDHKMKRKHR